MNIYFVVQKLAELFPAFDGLLSLFFSSSFDSFHHRLTPNSVSYRLLSIFETDKIDNYDVIQHLENTQRMNNQQ